MMVPIVQAVLEQLNDNEAEIPQILSSEEQQVQTSDPDSKQPLQTEKQSEGQQGEATVALRCLQYLSLFSPSRETNTHRESDQSARLSRLLLCSLRLKAQSW